MGPKERLDFGKMKGTGPGSSECEIQNKGHGIKDTFTEPPLCVRHHADAVTSRTAHSVEERMSTCGEMGTGKRDQTTAEGPGGRYMNKE